MSLLTALTVGVRADGRSTARAAPATWGQRSMWSCVQWMGEDDPYFNAVRLVDVPPGRRLDDVSAALAAVLCRHEALRTTFRYGPDGDLEQVVHGEGELTVEIRRATPATARQVAEAWAPELVGRAFLRDDWQIRVGVVADGGEPSILVVACGHLAVDNGGFTIVLEDLARALTGADLGPPPVQPATVAAHERSPAGRDVSDRALSHWARGLARAPVSVFDFPAVEPDRPRFRRLSLSSRAIGPAVDALAVRLRVSTSAVLLAAVATALGRYTGHRRVVFRPICANRDDDLRRPLVGTLSGDGLLVLDTGGATFDHVVRTAFAASLSAYRYGYYDPAAQVRLRESVGRSRGAPIDLSAHFNDVRPNRLGAVQPADPSSVDLRRLAEHSTVAEGGAWPRVDSRFFATVTAKADATVVALMCDTAFVPRAAMEDLLRGVERLLLAAVDVGGVAADRIDAVLGVRPVRRGKSWVPYDDGWVDLDASARLLRRVAGVDAAVFVEPAEGGGHRLVGCLGGATRMSIVDLRETVLAQIGERDGIRAPDWYVCCAGTPDRPDNRVEWDGELVHAQGPGTAAAVRR
jgi:hypothetical protein